ncbi:MAG: ATP-dependent DNA helicase RecG [Lachnospiraceae bacterium]|nr:ATP-dependent DNA helicase RecG [Lachnospiraceae bacterium]
MEKTTDIRELKGIGEKSAKLFAKVGVYNLVQLAEYFPRTYEVPEQVRAVCECREGEAAAVRVMMNGSFTTRKVRNLSVSNTTAADESGQLSLTFFNMPFLKNSLRRGTFYILRGMVKQSGTQLCMEQPKIYSEEEYARIAGKLCPRYALTQGLTNQLVTKTVRQGLERGKPWQDFLPEWVREKYGLETYENAVCTMHFPESEERLIHARKRLVFDEFLTFMLQLQAMKERIEVLPNVHPMIATADTVRLIEALPYELTGAQKRTWQEIEEDLSGSCVMNRLVQGDVGSGKTILAFLALLMCAGNGLQGAMMAPTEVLARQHFEQAVELTEKYHLPFHPVLLTGSVTASARKKIYQEIAEGRANLIIGTHALIQEKVEYRNLGLVVTDEQHRFGVRQREALAGKGEGVHVLVMSATPIPRTLAMILYGDLDISLVDERPADRLPVKNCVVTQKDRGKIYRFLEKEAASGRQVYVICPMVEEGELENVENVMDYAEKLREHLPKSMRIEYLHGKMKSSEKNRIMEEFSRGQFDVLVSTTVIEVGINVPNATVMLIENAERFGLAQLHQLRGRVGRGKWQSYCIFVSGSDKRQTMERLDILNHSNDGFKIAEEDLKLRGPGDLFGIRQSGLMDFKIGDVFQDADILKQASECAAEMLQNRHGEESDRLWEYLHTKQSGMVDFHSL